MVSNGISGCSSFVFILCYLFYQEYHFIFLANFADRFLDIVDDSKACYTFYTEEWRILCLFAGNNPGITRRCLQQSANI